jgi:sugar lactone lactonase YvrE
MAVFGMRTGGILAVRRTTLTTTSQIILCAVFAFAWCFSAEAGTVATRVLGQPDFTHGAPNTLSAGSLNFPGNHGSGAVAVDVVNNHVYVADTGNNRVLGWESISALTTGKFPDIVIGQVDFESSVAGTSSTTLSSPNGIAVDSAGNVYVADTGNSRVLMFPDPFTSFTKDGQFSNFEATVVLGQVGNFTSGSCDVDTSSPDSETICSPQGVAVDSDNNVWVADTGNNRVVEYNGPVTADSFFEDLVFGQLGSFTSKTANNGGISKNSLNQPNGVAVDGHGNLYVADSSNNRVLEFNTPLSVTAIAGSGDTTADEVWGQAGSFTTSSCASESASTLCLPTKVAVDGSDNLYIGDTQDNRALMFNESNPPTNVSANVVLGQTSATTNTCLAPPTASSLCFPNGVAASSSGNLFVADGADNRVVEYTAPLASGAAAAIALGQTDLIHKNQNVVNASSLDNPAQIAFDPSTGGLYVADTVNNRILGWRSAADFTNFEPAALVLGQPDFQSNEIDRTGTVGANGFSAPSGVAVDGNGNLYVSDFVNSRVLEFNAPFAACAGVFPCVGGSSNLIFGQTSATSSECDQGGANPTASTLCEPRQLAVDKFNNLWVADNNNSRVLEYYTPLTTTSVAGSGDTTADFVLGQGAAGDSFTTGSCETISATSLCSPTGVAVDQSGNIWVGDSANNRVLEYNETVTATIPAANATADTVFGENGSFTSSSPPNTGPNSLDGPQGVIVDSNGNLFVADVGTNRVLEFFSPLAVTATPGSGDTTADVVFGQGGDFVAGVGAGSAPSNETLDLALSVMVDASNSLYISDQGANRILAYPLPYNPPGAIKLPPPSGVLEVRPTSLRFEATAIGESRTREVKLENAGSTQIAIGTLSAAGDFVLDQNCSAILLPGQTCTVRVTFAPMVKGRRGGMLYVNDNADGAPHLVHIVGHATARRRRK